MWKSEKAFQFLSLLSENHLRKHYFREPCPALEQVEDDSAFIFSSLPCTTRKNLRYDYSASPGDSTSTNIRRRNFWNRLLESTSGPCFQTLKAAMEKYGVVVLRRTSFDDSSLIAFGKKFGRADVSTPHKDPNKPIRIPIPEIFDVSNLNENNEIFTDEEPRRVAIANANSVWHADGHYNPLRTSWSMLRAVELPPKGAGGETEFLDSRAAYEDLPIEMKDRIENLVGMNSMMARMKYANRGVEPYESLKPEDYPFAKHAIAALHEASGRKNLYISYYTDHIEGMTKEEGQALLYELMEHMKQDKYKLVVQWDNPGDVTIWDNTAVLHRATQGPFSRKYRRDMRRVSILDNSKEAYGFNSVDDLWKQGAP